jgi:uncharacterized protein YecT (DUF1311 family)
MIHQHTTKDMNRFYSIILSLVFFKTHAACTEIPDMVLAPVAPEHSEECDLTKVPLMKCDIYKDYKIADSGLNRSYHNLAKSIPNSSVTILRKTQHEWIRFRDDKCADMQRESGCDNAFCTGVAHDECMLDLTNERAKELVYFLNHPEKGISLNYKFDKRYPKGKQY